MDDIGARIDHSPRKSRIHLPQETGIPVQSFKFQFCFSLFFLFSFFKLPRLVNVEFLKSLQEYTCYFLHQLRFGSLLFVIRWSMALSIPLIIQSLETHSHYRSDGIPSRLIGYLWQVPRQSQINRINVCFLELNTDL